MSLDSRRQALTSAADRYPNLDRSGKSVLLTELSALTGYNRKYLTSQLNRLSRGVRAWVAKPAAHHRRRSYGKDLHGPLGKLWAVSGNLCGKRLVPAIPQLLASLERFGEIELCPAQRAKLLSMSAATADRLLSEMSGGKGRGVSTTDGSPLLRQQISVRTWEDWSDARPGFVEADLVAHCGPSPSGEFAYTLTIADVSTQWTECVGIPSKSRVSVVAGLERARRRLPFPLLGIDTDNGTEFLNGQVSEYCAQTGVTFTRGRPYNKNDQCHVEQKNDARVRAVVGYSRLSGDDAVRLLDRIHELNGQIANFFAPSAKLVSKTRDGAKVRRVYDKPTTPADRLIASGVLNEAEVEELRKRRDKLNPARIRRVLYQLQCQLDKLMRERGAS